MDSTDIGAWLSERKARHLLRTLRTAESAGGVFDAGGVRRVNFASNDYLDLARDSRVIEGAAEAALRWGAGAGASRLMSGSLPCHEELECALAKLKGYPAALVFGSGYGTNLGILDALSGPRRLVLADRLAHASLLDGARLAGARLRRFRHNDAAHLRALLAGTPERAWVLTESVFSMDGDQAPLAELADACTEAGAGLLVDEAHATGVLGPGGSGAVRGAGLEGRVDLCMGTLSKALASFGGFVACSLQMRDFLVNASRPFIYSTALPPPCAGAALAALRVLEKEPQRIEGLAGRSRAFRRRLAEAGFPVTEDATPIVPVLVGSAARAVQYATALEREGILAVAVRPPTVPPGSSRIRFSLTLAHTDDDLAAAVDALTLARERLS